jgi:hypothetical protein
VSGAAVGGIGGYASYQMSVNYPLTNQAGNIVWQNVATQATVSGVIGCASASAGGGNCGRGALAGAVGTVGSAYGFTGAVIAGCAAGRIGGGSCGNGALNTVGTYAAYSAVQYILRQSLSYSTVSGPEYGSNGAVDWKINWQLRRISQNGGYIVQDILVMATGTDDTGNPTLDIIARYWEAWQVAPGGNTTTTVSQYGYDDAFFFSGSPRSVSGSVKWSSSAMFYEGLTLPSSFVPKSVGYAGDLPATTVNPDLSLDKATLPINRDFTRIWP